MGAGVQFVAISPLLKPQKACAVLHESFSIDAKTTA
jgi:hypothetical protein